MRKRLQDTSTTAAGAGMEALHHQTLADMGMGNDEIVHIERVVVLGVGNGALQALAHIKSDPLARKFEIGERRGDLLAANEAGNEVQLLWADAQVARYSLGFLVAQRAGGSSLAQGLLPLRFFVRGMAVERAGRRVLAKLLAHHFLGHCHGDVLLAIVDAER